MTLAEAKIVCGQVFKGKQMELRTRGLHREVVVEGKVVGRAVSWKAAAREACAPWKAEIEKRRAEHDAEIRALEEAFVSWRTQSPEALAERMFNAYNAAGETPWKTFDGRDVPRWDAINEAVKGKWTAAARSALLPPEEIEAPAPAPVESPAPVADVAAGQ